MAIIVINIGGIDLFQLYEESLDQLHICVSVQQNVAGTPAVACLESQEAQEEIARIEAFLSKVNQSEDESFDDCYQGESEDFAEI